MVPVEGEMFAAGGPPESGKDLELLFESLKAFPGGREGDPERSVFVYVPGSADAQLDPAAAHLVDLRDRHGERAG